MPERDLGRSLDRGLGVFVGAFGLAVFIASREMSYMGAGGPGPGFLPTWLGATLALCGVLLVLGSLRRTSAWSPELPDRSGWLHVAAALSAIVAAAVTLRWLGFLTVAAALTFFLAWGLARRSARVAGLLALGLAGGFALGFGVLLRTPLPKGPWGF